MNYILISDLDDTLTGDREGIKEFNKMITSNKDKFYLVYSSGRFKSSILSLIEEEGLISPCAIVTNVGTEIYYAPSWKIDNEWIDIIGSNWNKEGITSIVERTPIEPQLHDKRFSASYYVEDDSIVRKIEKELEGFEVKVIHTKKRNLDIIPDDAGKGNAALYLKEKKNLPLVCCGDSENDKDMLKKSDYGILVGNAVEKVKDKLSNCSNVYQATGSHANGIIEGLQFYGFID